METQNKIRFRFEKPLQVISGNRDERLATAMYITMKGLFIHYERPSIYRDIPPTSFMIESEWDRIPYKVNVSIPAMSEEYMSCNYYFSEELNDISYVHDSLTEMKPPEKVWGIFIPRPTINLFADSYNIGALFTEQYRPNRFVDQIEREIAEYIYMNIL